MVTRLRWGTATLVFLSVLCLLPATHAEWSVSALERQPVADGVIEYRRYSLGESAAGAETEVHLALFSPQDATLRVLDQPDFGHRLADAMARENCLAGVNGGYFDPQGAPVGLLRSGGKMIAPLRRARLLSGVLAVQPGRVQIFRASEFPTKSAWPEAIQCGPFLVDRGKPVAGLEDTRSARRTFVLTTSDRRVALGYCAPLPLARLARVLAALSQLQVTRALNLDGGSSSAFWCRTEGQTVSLPESKPVRDFLSIVPLSNR